MAKNNVYSSYWSWIIAGGNSNSSTFEITAALRELKLKSIFLDIQLYDQVNTAFIPPELMDDTVQLRVATLLPDTLTMPFLITAGAAPFWNGTGIYISRAGQYFFDSFYIKNRLPLYLYAQNAGVNQKVFNISVVLETEELQLYNQ